MLYEREPFTAFLLYLYQVTLFIYEQVFFMYTKRQIPYNGICLGLFGLIKLFER